MKSEYVPWKANMCRERQLCVLKGEHPSWKVNICPGRRLCAVEGEYMPVAGVDGVNKGKYGWLRFW